MPIIFLDGESEKHFNDDDKIYYRVISLDRAIEMLDKNRWAFVSPSLWNDPFEKAFLNADYNHVGKEFNLPFKPDKRGHCLFAQCWTVTRESEAFWKTYTPNEDGIRISIKATILFKVLNNIRDYTVYVGYAKYEDYRKLYAFKTDNDIWTELKKPIINKDHLRMMLKKRHQFSYEVEIRILLIRKSRMKRKVAKLRVRNTHKILEKFTLDPRMGSHIANFLKRKLKDHYKVTGDIEQSQLYKKPGGIIKYDS